MRLLRLQDASQMVAGSSETIGQPSVWDHVNCCKATNVKNVEIFPRLFRFIETLQR